MNSLSHPRTRLSAAREALLSGGGGPDGGYGPTRRKLVRGRSAVKPPNGALAPSSINCGVYTDAILDYRIIDNGNSIKGGVMANNHKIVVTVTAQRRTVSISMRGKGNILRLPLSGYNLDLTAQPIPTTASKKAYVTAVLDAVIAALPDE